MAGHSGAMKWALLVLLCHTPLFAQSHATTGAIEGTVVDAQGGAVPGVTVTVKNTATNYERVSVTDRSGRFRAVLLPLGPYSVSNYELFHYQHLVALLDKGKPPARLGTGPRPWRS